MTLRDLVPSLGKKRVPVRRDEHPSSFFNEDVHGMFDHFFSGFDMDPFGKTFGSFSPRVEVAENDKEIKVTAELPGLDEKDVDVSLSADRLTISGEKKEEREKSGKDYFVRERSYGTFKRSIPLTSNIKTDGVNAGFKKGVLTITLPKVEAESEKKKKITVRVD